MRETHLQGFRTGLTGIFERSMQTASEQGQISNLTYLETFSCRLLLLAIIPVEACEHLGKQKTKLGNREKVAPKSR
jgi:DNA gyrase/topoisomerase IV subunit B